MNSRTMLLAVLAVSMLFVGAVGAASAQPNDDADSNAGPPVDLPGPVPDFVENILGSIADFLSGSVDALGGVVSGVASGR